MNNQEIIKLAKKILPILSSHISPESEAMLVKEKLKKLIQQAKDKPEDKQIIQQIIDLLYQYPQLKQWIKNHLSPAQDNSRGDDIITERGDKTEDKPHLYPVWFGTNRKPLDSNDLSKGFTGQQAEDATTVYYGRCDVEVPKTHRFGETGRSWWKRWASLDFKGNDHLRLNKIHIAKDADNFWQVLNNQFLKNDIDQKDALIFLHGFNSSFKDAAIRAAQIGFDLKVAGHTAFFSWPSKAKTLKYAVDERTIQASTTAITHFLTDFVQKSGAKKVHLIAHSMGNRGLLAALEKIAQNVTTSDAKIQFGQIILAAPDLDVSVFRQAKEAYTQLSQTTTVYTSSTDIPVSLSRRLHEYPRLGLVPPITIEKGIDTIKVNNFNLFNLGHGYYAEAEALLSDIYDLIHNGKSPDKRQRPQKQKTKTGKFYWLIDTR